MVINTLQLSFFIPQNTLIITLIFFWCMLMILFSLATILRKSLTSPIFLINISNKNLGDLTYFLDLKISKNSKGVNVSQRKYMLDLLTETRMLACSPTITPMVHSSRLLDEIETNLMTLKLHLTEDSSTASSTSQIPNHTSQSKSICFLSNHCLSIDKF